jgi:hypothetical protein
MLFLGGILMIKKVNADAVGLDASIFKEINPA